MNFTTASMDPTSVKLGSLFSPPTNGTASSPFPPTMLGMSEFHASVFLPIISFWIVSCFYETLEYFDWFAQHRIVPTAEEQKRNLVSRWEVARTTLAMHAVQIVFVLAFESIFPQATQSQESVWGAFGSVEYFGFAVLQLAAKIHIALDPRLAWVVAQSLRWVNLLMRQFACFIILDTWVFWVHYITHASTYLYRTFHPPQTCSIQKRSSSGE